MSESMQERMGRGSMLKVFQRRHLATTCPVATKYFSAGQTVLDVGCGPGSMTLDIARQVHPGRVTGVDLTPAAIERARELSVTESINNADFVVGDIYRLPFSDSTFEVSFCINVIEHLRDPIAALRELSRVTRPTGWVIMVRMQDWGGIVFNPDVPAFRSMVELLERHADLLLREADFYYGANSGSRLLQYYSQAGMRDIEITGFVGPDQCVRAGTPEFDATLSKWKTYFDFQTQTGRAIRECLRRHKLWGDGAANDLLAQLDKWHDSPYGFELGAGVCAAARPAVTE